jgi:hypothetical protein
MASPLVVRNRAELFASLRGRSSAEVLACMTAYSPPSQRLLIRSEADLARLGTTAAALKAAADPSFWAYSDFDSVLASFGREAGDPERRVMGVEGVGSAETLAKVLATGEQVLCIGHLSLTMMESKVASGEWRWIEEAGCVMHTATNKPALLRAAVRAKFGLELKVLRHEKFAADAGEQPESSGDLIIFDMDWKDVTRRIGNTNVFCQVCMRVRVCARARHTAQQLRPRGKCLHDHMLHTPECSLSPPSYPCALSRV